METWKDKEYESWWKLILQKMKQKMKVRQNQKKSALANGYLNKEIERTAITRN